MSKLQLQQTCFENIKALCTNYRKDSSSRKTEEYLNVRLASLEAQWQDFEARNALLVLEVEDKTITYFAENVYEKTKEMYLNTKADIDKRQSVLTEHKRGMFDLAGTSEDDSQETNKTCELQRLLNKQECNFNAIHRAMSKIDISLVTEKWELEENISILKSKWETIDKLHWEIDFQLKVSNAHYYETFTSLEEQYDDLRKKLNSKIWSNAHYEKSAPRMELPEFSRNYGKWISFKDLFLETIHNNPTINLAQKMRHLKTKLKGEAESLVQHLSVSAENYNSCWEILTQRYDNRRLQFTSFFNTMMNLPVIQHPDSNNLKKMHDVIKECMNGMANIGLDTSTWDPVIVQLVLPKLDSATLNDYMNEIRDHREIQNLSDFLYFLECKFMAYETAKSTKKSSAAPEKTSNLSSKWKTSTKKTNFDYKKSYYYHAVYGKCPHCSGNHVLMQCDKFLEMDTTQRNNIVAKLRLCKNCLYSHNNEECKSKKLCKECNLKHHTLLHHSNKKFTSTKSNHMGPNSSTSSQHQANHLSNCNTEILLTTIQLKIKSVDGTYLKLRALLDQGAQGNLITENAAQLLRLPRKKLAATVTGIGAVSEDCRGQINLSCKSIHSDFAFETQALIMKKLTNNLPHSTFDKGNWPHLENLKLADPDFNVSRPVDLLLGADVYAEILMDGVLKGCQQSPVAQQTQLGWILCGKMRTINCHVAIINMEELTKFWESEKITSNKTSKDECEQFYQETVQRAPDGKYIVKMPLCSDFEEKLGNSRPIAISQFLQLEKRLKRNTNLAAMYKDFINEYADLGHMKPSSHSLSPTCYLPHHGVLRENATTTKLRVVFNASQKNSNGLSLNSLLEKGPNLQKDIQALIIKWRTHKFALIADIQMMYRCIWIADEQQHLQKIIWRETSTESLREFQLCTLTYGTKCAPWLAMRTLIQLANDDGHKFPAAKEALKNSFFMDDLICGKNTISEAKELQQSLIALLKSGGMNLRKWSSNHPSLLEELPKDQIAPNINYEFKTEEPSKTLGLGWNPTSDTFHFNWPINDNSRRSTKRSLLSDISKFYDPLGWLSPVTVTAKLLFQKLWISKLDWDDDVPKEIELEWVKLKTELPLIKNITLNRWIGETNQNIELLGFCDASEKAYACVVYCRTRDEHGTPKITLVAARTRVAPLAQKTTLPKLELCGALLLAELMEKINEALSNYNITLSAWSDFQVTLAWIQGETTKWEVYVANRVNKIKRIIPAPQWRYIKSEQNPADCASRGILPSKLITFNLWWQGPDFLKNSETKLNLGEPCSFQTNHGCIIYGKEKSNLKSHDENIITTLLNKCSSLLRVTRLTAWILRFINNIRNAKKLETNYLTANELKTANIHLIKHMQRTQFAEEYKQLKKKEPISKRSSILKLSPYLGEDNLIRVGGRLKNSNLPLEMKNPIIVPYCGRFTQLLIDQAHLNTLHGGARLTLTYIRQRYWIVGGNRAVKTQLRRCVRCHRFSQADNNQLMGDLPSQRVTPCRPFTHTGVDFTGNVEIKLNKGRGVKTSKGYIAIFICMTTKAVHLELVSDLSTETFIAAFQRLCARRGTPKHMYSDCGTNFVGASKILKQEFEEFKKLQSQEFFNELAKQEVEWHFNCPRWPHAAGLWESAVKSMKHHLRRVLGDQKLTYEEFNTLLTKIEACLNSRPLCPLTEDPEEFYSCLTPGHFITGSSTMSLPLSNYSDTNIDLRRRWHLVEQMFQQYWKTWSSDYLTQLQVRSKWNKPTKNIKVGDIVLVKEDNLAPGKWAMGRVLETHPGSDGYVRVTTIKTQSGILKRPVVKLSPLPLDSETETIDPETETQKETNRNCEQKTRQTKGNKTLSSLLITMLTMFTFLSGSYGFTAGVSSGAHITSLERERPIYYDTIGKMQMVHNEWTLIMYYNLSTYWEGNRHLDDYFDNLKNLCVKSNLQQCQTTTEQLRHEMDILHHYNDILINPHKHLTANRKKRGLIDGVGYIANSLFGVLDQRFAEKYENDIQSMRNNDNYLLELIKNQTTIVELENKILKKSDENIQRQFKMIGSFVNQTNQNMAALESEIEILSATTYFNSASLTLYLLINSLKNFQEMLFDSLTNVYQGHVDVHLITPVHLIHQLSEISGSIPKSLSLPVENYKDDIKELYKLIYVKARVTENYFLFEMHIPLISNEDFTLYQAMPLPMKIDKNFASVRVTSKYIGVNFEKNIYVLMTEDDFKHCSQQKTEKIICKINPPVFDLHSYSAPCEAKLLSHHNSAPCDLERTDCKDSWIELHSSNSWLIVCCESCSVRMICSSDVTSYSMTSSGIITLPQGCVAQSKDLSIYSHSHYRSQTKMDYELIVPTFNMNTSVNKIVNLTNYRAFPRELHFDKLDEDIAYQEKQEARLPTISSHDIHQYVISYTLVAAAVVVLLVLVGRKYCTTRYTRNKKTTSPIQHTEDIELQVIRRPDEFRERAAHHAKLTPGPSRRSATGGTPNLAFNFD